MTGFPPLLSRVQDQVSTWVWRLLRPLIVLGLWWGSSTGIVFAQGVPESGLDPLTQEALDQFNQGNWQESLSRLQTALEQAQSAGNWQQVGETWNNIGLVQEQLNETDQALEAYQSALAAYENLGSTGNIREAKIGEAKTLNNLGGIYLNLQQPEAALGFLERSLVLWREVGLAAEESITLRNLGGIYTAVNRFADGIQALQQSLTLEKTLGNTAAQLTVQERLAALYTQVGALPEALRMLEESVALAQTSGNAEVEAILLSQVGEVQELGNNYAGAIVAYEQSLARLETLETSQTPAPENLNTQNAIVELLTRLGSLHHTLEQTDQAIERYQQAIDRVSSTENPLFWGELMVSLGQIYSQAKNWSAAQDTYTAALKVVEPLQVPLAQAQLLRGLGAVYQGQNDLPQALQTLQQALALQQQAKSNPDIPPEVQQQEEGLTLNLLGDLYRQQQDYDKALPQYQAAYQALETSQDAFGQGDTLQDLGLTQLLRNAPQEAIQPLLSAVQLWQLLSYQLGRFLEPSVEAHQLLQAALIRSGQPALALVSAEDERSFPIRLSQTWESSAADPTVRISPPEPLGLEEIQRIAATTKQPILFYDLAAEPGITAEESVNKLRIWFILPSGEITLREITLSVVGINTPEDLVNLVINSQDGEEPTQTADLEQLSNLLITPITLDLDSLDPSATPILQLVIPPIFLGVPFENLTIANPSGTPDTLGDRFQLALYPSILTMTTTSP